MEWRDQVAVVTGGARGLGRATAWLLARRGAAVCVNYAAHGDAAEALIAEIAAAGGRAIAVAADVAEVAAVEAMVDRTETELGPVTILVNEVFGTHNGQIISGVGPFLKSRAIERHAYTVRQPRRQGRARAIHARTHGDARPLCPARRTMVCGLAGRALEFPGRQARRSG